MAESKKRKLDETPAEEQDKQQDKQDKQAQENQDKQAQGGQGQGNEELATRIKSQQPEQQEQPEQKQKRQARPDRKQEDDDEEEILKELLDQDEQELQEQDMQDQENEKQDHGNEQNDSTSTSTTTPTLTSTTTTTEPKDRLLPNDVGRLIAAWEVPRLVRVLSHLGAEYKEVLQVIIQENRDDNKTRKIYCRNLPRSLTLPEFREFFSKWGTITDATIIVDKDTSISKGYGFVTYNTVEEANACLDEPVKIINDTRIPVGLALTNSEHTRNPKLRRPLSVSAAFAAAAAAFPFHPSASSAAAAVSSRAPISPSRSRSPFSHSRSRSPSPEHDPSSSSSLPLSAASANPSVFLDDIVGRKDFSNTTATKLFVWSLSSDTTAQMAFDFFSQYGEVQQVVIVNDRQTGLPRGFGFVTMASEEGATNVLGDPDVFLNGRNVHVKLCLNNGEHAKEKRFSFAVEPWERRPRRNSEASEHEHERRSASSGPSPFFGEPPREKNEKRIPAPGEPPREKIEKRIPAPGEPVVKRETRRARRRRQLQEKQQREQQEQEQQNNNSNNNNNNNDQIYLPPLPQHPHNYQPVPLTTQQISQRQHNMSLPSLPQQEQPHRFFTQHQQQPPQQPQRFDPPLPQKRTPMSVQFPNNNHQSLPPLPQQQQQQQPYLPPLQQYQPLTTQPYIPPLQQYQPPLQQQSPIPLQQKMPLRLSMPARVKQQLEAKRDLAPPSSHSYYNSSNPPEYYD